MEVTCPQCSTKWDWEPPPDSVGIRKGPSTRPDRSYSITCPNPKCSFPLDIEL